MTTILLYTDLSERSFECIVKVFNKISSSNVEITLFNCFHLNKEARSIIHVPDIIFKEKVIEMNKLVEKLRSLFPHNLTGKVRFGSFNQNIKQTLSQSIPDVIIVTTKEQCSFFSKTSCKACLQTFKALLFIENDEEPCDLKKSELLFSEETTIKERKKILNLFYPMKSLILDGLHYAIQI